MPSWAWGVAVVIGAATALVVIGLALAGVANRRRSEQRRRAWVRQRFGPEYDRLAGGSGERRAAEFERLEKLHQRLDIIPLDRRDREVYGERWRGVQARFVDQPSSAVREADALVAEVMGKRGYPREGFEQRAADISVEHPLVVKNYRAAHALLMADERDQASTEDLRQAMVHYRALFDELLESEESARRSA